MEELGGEGREGKKGREGVAAPFNVLPQGATDVVAPLHTSEKRWTFIVLNDFLTHTLLV